MAVYDHCKHLCKLHQLPFGLDVEGPPLHMLAGCISGLAFATAAAPGDIIKGRIMGDQTGRYSGALDCLRQLVQKEGMLTLFKGS